VSTIGSNIDYTNRDYESLLPDLIARMRRALPEWSSASDADFLMLLLQVFAYTSDQLHFYIDRVAMEAFLQTAALRSSVLRIAEMLDYRPISLQAARTTVQFTATLGNGVITIPAGTRMVTAPVFGNQPIFFETIVDADIDTDNESTTNVVAHEGRTVSRELVATSAGSVDQAYALFNTKVIEGSWHVFVSDGPLDVNGAPTFTEWVHVARMIEATATQSAFTAVVNERGVTFIIFGDGASGRVPPAGATIEVTYRYGVGSVGNIGSGLVRDLVSSITGITGVTNIAPATGGSDPETIQSMRSSIPRAVRALDRAVTLEDYNALALQVAGVGKATAVAGSASSVTVYVAPIGGGTPNTQLKEDVAEYFETRIMAGATLVVSNPVFTPVNVTLDIEVNPRYLRSAVKSAVELALVDLLSFTQTSFGQRLALADAFRAVVNVDGVDFVDIDVLSTGPTGTDTITMEVHAIPTAGTITVNATGGIS
jgi:hypothetical protein